MRVGIHWWLAPPVAHLLIVVCLLSRSSFADDWPGWRGADRNGVSGESNLPVQWSANTGVRWKTPLPGSGISNPIVVGDRVICTSSDGVEQRDLHVICLDRTSGAERWHAKLWGTAPTLYHATKSSMAR